MNKSDVLDTLINTEIAVKEFGHHTRGIIAEGVSRMQY